ncbi:leucine-rich repeats and immunoglobulin-like domains protein 1 [Dermacentor silvarum]|uniref:leucine-rich repeats and immunoglobulin-like domains protein 1 n=1 Tax=Dermacentor silvarum TaxID=543639 RepID=UPI0021012FDF|nr:leucine-rich repeats and immunoglobulin-like domains protein 1 [Dermacentor silvarum]
MPTTDSATGGTTFTSASHEEVNLNCTFVTPLLDCRGEQTHLPLLPLLTEKLLKAVQSGSPVTTLFLAIESLGSLENGSMALENIQKLHIVRSDISTVLPGAFVKAATLHALDLSENKLALVPSSALQDLSSLTSLNLSNNYITELTEDTFKNIHSLKSLSLERNEVSSISVGTFFHMEHLEDLNLSHNKLTAFDSSAFGKTALKILKLSSNHLASVSLENSLEFLEHLYLDHNRLNSATMKLVLPSLTTLNVSYNTLDKPKFDSLASLVTLSISSNPLTMLSRSWLEPLHKLEILDASCCKLKRLDSQSLSGIGSLRLLNVSGNQISFVDSTAFVGLYSLTTVDLSNNALTYINQNHTADLGLLEHIDLSENSIEYIFAGAFAHSPRLRSINLNGNFLDCGCELRGFGNFLKHGNFSEETLSSAVCDDKSRISEFDFDTLGCPTESVQTTQVLPSTTTLPEISTAATSELNATKHTTMVPFNGHLTLVHVEQDNDKLSVTWNAHSTSDRLDKLQCLLTVVIIGEKTRTNLPGPCPPSLHNRTFHIFITKPGAKFEVCLLAFRNGTEVARSCSILNTTDIKTSTPVAVPTTGLVNTTLPYERTTAVAFNETSAVTTEMEIQTPSQKAEDGEFLHRLNFRSRLSAQKQLIIRWNFLPPFPTKSKCRFNVTVLCDKDLLTQTEAPCYTAGQVMVARISEDSDYDVCFSQLVLNIPADCHEIVPAKLASNTDIAVGAAATGSRRETRIPVALLIMIAALALIAILAIALFIHRRLRKRAIARRKVGESVFHLQMNRRSGTYMVQDATEARTTLTTSVSQDGTKMSQRASSIDEL